MHKQKVCRQISGHPGMQRFSFWLQLNALVWKEGSPFPYCFAQNTKKLGVFQFHAHAISPTAIYPSLKYKITQ